MALSKKQSAKKAKSNKPSKAKKSLPKAASNKMKAANKKVALPKAAAKKKPVVKSKVSSSLSAKKTPSLSTKPTKKTQAAKALATKSIAKAAASRSSTQKTTTSKSPTVKSSTAKSLNQAQKQAVAQFHKNFQPVGEYVLIQQAVESDRTPGGLYIPAMVQDRPAKGSVLATGHGVRTKKGLLKPLDVQVGEVVVFGPYAGTKVVLEGQDYLLLKESEVLGVIRE